MSKFDESLFGRLAVGKKFVTRELLERCAEERSAEQSPLHIGEYLLERGHLSQRQFDEIAEVRNRKVRKLRRSKEEAREQDREFGRLAVERELLGYDELESAVLEQQSLRQRNLHFTVAEVLLSKDLVRLQDVHGIFELQGRGMMRCSLCDFQYRVVDATDRASCECPRCHSTLSPPVYLDPLLVEGVVDPSAERSSEGSVAAVESGSV